MNKLLTMVLTISALIIVGCAQPVDVMEETHDDAMEDTDIAMGQQTAVTETDAAIADVDGIEQIADPEAEQELDDIDSILDQI